MSGRRRQLARARALKQRAATAARRSTDRPTRHQERRQLQPPTPPPQRLLGAVREHDPDDLLELARAARSIVVDIAGHGAPVVTRVDFPTRLFISSTPPPGRPFAQTMVRTAGVEVHHDPSLPYGRYRVHYSDGSSEVFS